MPDHAFEPVWSGKARGGVGRSREISTTHRVIGQGMRVIRFARVHLRGHPGGERNIATGLDHTKQRNADVYETHTPPSSSGTRAASHEGAAGRGAGVSAREAEGVRSLARLAAVWCTRTDRVGRRTIGAGGCAWWPAAQCISTSVHVSSKYPKPAAV